MTDADFAGFADARISADDFACLVASACLAHDIGNPPFGHAGDDAISEYFRAGHGREFLDGLTEEQKADFREIDGNPLGFRLLTHTFPLQSALSGGLSLTYATLGAFMKYPRESVAQPAESQCASERKLGFFQSEKDSFKEVASNLGLKPKHSDGHLAWCRHPLAFLVEAADDICYRIVDLEDGFKLQLVTFEDTEKLLSAIIVEPTNDARFSRVMDRDEKVKILRALAINNLVAQVKDVFIERQAEITNATFDSPLTDYITSCDAFNQIKEVTARSIYDHRPVVAVESAGFEIIHGLLDTFLHAALVSDHSDRYKRIRKLIPDQYVLESDAREYSDKYSKILNITQFVSSMTDKHAIDTYRLIKGIALPNY